MNTYLLKEATKIAMMATKATNVEINNVDDLSNLIMTFYQDIEDFAKNVLFFSIDEIENMGEMGSNMIIDRYID